MQIKTVLFDLGGVLVDWNPEYVFSQVFETHEGMRYFLDHICTFHWNEQQDAGRTIAEAEDVLIKQHPQYTKEIKMYYGRWTEMLGGPIDEMVQALREILDSKKYGVYALTNWSAETWPTALEIFDFLSWFDGVLVSGQVKMKKPDAEIFHKLCTSYNIIPQETVFIDDNLNNIITAKALGFQTIHFNSRDQVALVRQLI